MILWFHSRGLNNTIQYNAMILKVHCQGSTHETDTRVQYQSPPGPSGLRSDQTDQKMCWGSGYHLAVCLIKHSPSRLMPFFILFKIPTFVLMDCVWQKLLSVPAFAGRNVNKKWNYSHFIHINANAGDNTQIILKLNWSISPTETLYPRTAHYNLDNTF